jgi:hypothetical protein
MNDEWKEGVMACAKVLSWLLPGGTVENHKRASSGIIIIPFKV